MITQERLKEVLRYNSKTGVFTWRLRTSNCVIIGAVAGSQHNGGYLRIRIDGGSYLSHRLAWLYVYGEWPESQIDHINHARSDNRVLNLRSVTNAENHKNRTRPSNNQSGITGVTIHKPSGKWFVRIHVDGKAKHVGLYFDKFEAVCARRSAENKYGFHENHGK